MSRKYAQFYAMIRELPLSKEDIVNGFTGGATSSLRDLSDRQYMELLEMIQRDKTNFGWRPKPGDKQRKKMISLARQMGWGCESANPQKKILERLNTWCLAQKYKKPLMQHTENELNVILSIFEEKVYVSYLRDLNKT